MSAAIPVVAMVLKPEVQSLVEYILSPEFDFYDEDHYNKSFEVLSDWASEGDLDAVKGFLEIAEKTSEADVAISALLLAQTGETSAEIRNLLISLDLLPFLPKIIAEDSELSFKTIYNFHMMGNRSATVILQDKLSFDHLDLENVEMVSVMEEAVKLGNASAIKRSNDPDAPYTDEELREAMALSDIMEALEKELENPEFRNLVNKAFGIKPNAPKYSKDVKGSDSPLHERIDLGRMTLDLWNGLSPQDQEVWRQIESDPNKIPTAFIKHVSDSVSKEAARLSGTEENKKEGPGKKGGPKGMH